MLGKGEDTGRRRVQMGIIRVPEGEKLSLIHKDQCAILQEYSIFIVLILSSSVHADILGIL